MQSVVGRVFASPRFFWGVLGLFIFQALWLVFSAAYPMAFDEDFHVGIIRIYAEQWLPFLAGQPVGADAYGAVARDPSYLFHYVMSFPYRMATVFTDSQTVTVITLRLLNVAMFAGGLVLWRRVLRRIPLSAAATHFTLLLFVLIPIVPQLAAQVNYDNMLMPLTAGLFLLVLQVFDKLRAGVLPLQTMAVGALTGLVGGLIKYAFLPIFAAATLCVAGYILRQARLSRLKIKPAMAAGWRAIRLPVRVVLIALLLLVGVLMAERYGLNTVRYGDPIPDCGAVLAVEQCMQYGPWGRDYLLAQHKGDVDPNPVIYAARWVYGMWYRLFFAVNGNTVALEFRYQNFAPLPLVGAAGAILLAAGLALIVHGWRTIVQRPIFLSFTITGLFYAGVLWLQNYQMYLKTGQAVAINGRYLLLVLLPMVAVAVFFAGRALAAHPRLKTGLAVLAICAFLQGGLVTFIVRSNDSWYWPNAAVRSVNHAAQRVVSPIVIEQSIEIPKP